MKQKRRCKAMLLGMALIITVVFQGTLGGYAEVKTSLPPKSAYTVMGKVPILLYHDLNENPDKSGIAVTPEKFEEDLKALKQAGYTTMHFKELVDCIDRVKPWPSKPIIITFDDGYASNYKVAYPLLKQYAMKATFFIIGWSVGRRSENGDASVMPHFTWQEAKEMSASGLIDIQSHTFDLHSEEGISYGKSQATGKGVAKMAEENSFQYQNRLAMDFKINNQLILEATGKAPIILAYPMGIRSFESDFAVQDAGLLGAVTTEKAQRVYLTRFDLRAMPRLNITMAIKSQQLVKYIESQPVK